MRFSGERMKRIRIQKPVKVRGNTGQVVNHFTDLDNDPNPWAHVRDDRGSETFQDEKKTATVVRFFQVHWRTDLNEKCTVVDEEDSRRYDIEQIFPIGKRKLDIKATWTDGQYDYPNDVHVEEEDEEE